MKNEPRNAPDVLDPSMIGEYPLMCMAGGGWIWDAVLEYRVWHCDRGDTECESFASYEEAAEWSNAGDSRDPVLALLEQREYYRGDIRDLSTLVQPDKPRITEWQVEWVRHNNHRPSMLDRAFGKGVQQ